MLGKILVVDGEPDLQLLISQTFRREIRRKELELVFAHHGLEALSQLEAQPNIDVVLTDINIPQMDGLTLLTKLSEHYPTTKAVIISADSDMGNIRAAMNHGAFDFLTKPLNLEDLKITIHKTLRHVQQIKEALQKERLAQQTQVELVKKLQQQLIQSDRMVALGQLVADIAHEINTPLGAIRASIGNITTALERSLQLLPQLFQQLSPALQADFFTLLETARHSQKALSTREERQFKRILKQELETQGFVDGDAVASALVNLGITKNITPFLPLLQDKNKGLVLETAHSLLTQKNNNETIQIAVERASKIVFALKKYVHQNSSSKMIKSRITEGIDIVLTLYNNQIKQGIKVIKSYQDIPEIFCYPEELNQVWTNLIHNAIQAMNNKGNLEIAVSQSDNRIVVQIADSGSGIPVEIKDRIFEPFFTTKPSGEGTGLGLDIVKKIIDKHQGKIEIESQPGRTKFSIFLPIH